MNFRYLIIFQLIFSLSLHAQHYDKWRTHLASNNTTAVAEGENYVYAMADGTLYSYGKSDNSIKIYTKQTGLSDSDVKLIRYNEKTHTLVIVYANGNIDLMNGDGIYNMPYLKQTLNIQDKTPNEISFNGDKAYLSANFGIIAIDLKKKEIAETYKLGMKTLSSCIHRETIYTITEKGLYTASVNDNLMDFNNWKKLSINHADLDEKKIARIEIFQDKLCICAPGSGLFYRETEGNVKALRKQIYIKGMKVQGDQLIAYTNEHMYLYDSLDGNPEIVSPGIVKDVAGLKKDNKYWIASGTKGLIGIKRKNAGSFETFVSGLNIEGPKRNLNAFMTVYKGKLLIAGGDRWTDRFNRPGTFMTYENGKWTNFDETTVSKAVGYACRDYTSVAADPDDKNHYFISTYGEGVIEVKDNGFVKLYNHKNTPLASALPDYAHAQNYVRTGSVCFDKNKNLWMTNCNTQNGIVVRTADGTWKSLFYKGVSDAPLVDKILITSKGHKWVNVPRGVAGILVFDDNGTPTDQTDDKSNFFSTFTTSGGKSLSVSEFYCMVEDLNGEIWVGTNHGPMVCTAPEKAIENPKNFFASQIIRPNDDGTNGLFLSSEQIKAMAVDGGNRKWLGTAGSGLFLVNANGTETIHHFTTENSPLLSDHIQSIAIDNKTGEVFIGTDKGLISYLGDATEPSPTYSDVYAYPNPVRPDYDGSVTVTGLMADSNVKITDLNGNLIYQAKSAGGQLSWNCRGQNGRPVATGIYLVLASTSQGEESVVTKIAVVR